MSDNDDIEVESDEEQPRFQSAADKRAHHNALERKRRDHIKDSFHSLRDSVPSLQGEKGTKMKLTLPPVFPYEHLPLPTVFCHG
ncbi:protein max isoform X7 [Papio anubis]|uniref:Protein max n=2 Tax=Cercopithecinae TaxID=9528 RepID=A0A2K5LSJ6_CERAT|nr:PREDICTED: protein max isoform X6 [Cercocebus atys]XP_031523911.1 protein max isoform X7 [Papio anubis]